jgi:hypothetical protein
MMLKEVFFARYLYKFDLMHFYIPTGMDGVQFCSS